MFSGLPMDTAHRRLNNKEFSNFIAKCTSGCIKGDPAECNFSYNSIDHNIPYLDSRLFDSTFRLKDALESVETAILQTERTAAKAKSAAEELATSSRDHPPEMLDKFTQDMYLIGRNKIISLGFYGNYLGYVASQISRLSVEAIRMIMCANAYGASLNDIVSIALMTNTKSGDYLFGEMDAKRSQGRIRQFNLSNIVNDIVPKDVIRKHYFGDPWNFVEIFYDDFIRCLIILRWVVNQAKKVGPTKTRDLCDKAGIKFVGLMRILEVRKQIMDSLRDFGIHNLNPEIRFDSDSLINDICRIKKCIYAGYKNNIAYYRNGSYETSTGIKFNANVLVRNKPQKIIYNSLIMLGKRDSIYYSVNADAICSLDGIL